MMIKELTPVVIENLRFNFPGAYRVLKTFCVLIGVVAPAQQEIRTRRGFAPPILYPPKSCLPAVRL